MSGSISVGGMEFQIHTTPEADRRAMAGILRKAAREIVWARRIAAMADPTEDVLLGPWPDECDADWAIDDLLAVIDQVPGFTLPVERLRAAADMLDPEREAIGRPVHFPWE